MRTGGYAYACETLQGGSTNQIPCRGELHVKDNRIIKIPGPHSHPALSKQVVESLRAQRRRCRKYTRHVVV